jgi:ectoine hydroxylase-related dioxygenase (phytanoyl-CoA dioxygenase family)
MRFRPTEAPGQDNLLLVWDELRRLDLLENVAELHALGLTVVEPDKTHAGDLTDRILARCVDLIEERTGTRPDLEGGETHRDVFYPSLHWVLFEDPLFEELVMNPVQLALVTYMLGATCVYGGSELFMKGPTTDAGDDLQLGLHHDQIMMPAPLPLYAQNINATWTLTDYTKADGCLAFLPGSHQLCRQPVGAEGADGAVPVETPKGSLILWHGNTWHGSYPKTTPGLRVGLASIYSRKYLTTPEPIAQHVTQEMLDRNPPRFAALMGVDLPFGWRAEGPDLRKVGGAVVHQVHD